MTIRLARLALEGAVTPGIRRSLYRTTAMLSSQPEESWWLTRDQRQLLLAIFGADTIASRAWKEWISRASIETMEPASMPLVPLLFRRSSYRAIAEPEIRRFKGVYRRTWYHNHLVLRELVVLLARFREARIKTLLPADLSILVASYNDIGLRPLDGLGVLVDPDQADTAANVLLAAGWKHNLPCALGKACLNRTSIRFFDGTAKQFELRWDAGAEPSARAAREVLWSTAVPTSVLGEETLAMSSTEQLLRVRQAGCWHPVPSGRWVADALTVLLRGESKLEWGRVIEFSQPSRMSLWVYSRLSYLRNEWSVSIPADVLEAIDQVPKSVIDRMEYGVRRSRVPISSDSVIYRALLRIRRWQDERPRSKAAIRP